MMKQRIIGVVLAVSGATMTSEAIKAAVRDCIDQAQKG